MKRFLMILILIISIQFLTFANDEYHLYYDSVRKLVPEKFSIPKINTLDFDDDGLNEVWAIGNTSDGYSKFFIYKEINQELCTYWSSPEMKGISYRWGLFNSDDTMHIWIETQTKELELYKIWVYKWNSNSTYLLSPINFDDEENSLVSKLSFSAGSTSSQDGEYEFKAYFPDENGTSIKSYAFRRGNFVLKHETYKEKSNSNSVQSSKNAESPESLIDLWIKGTFPGYEVIDLRKICYVNQLYLVSIKKEQDKEISRLILEQQENTILFWYYLSEQYFADELVNLEKMDLNYDGHIELLLYSRATDYQLRLYIISILPNQPRLLTPLDEDGVSTVVVTGPVEFKNYSKNNHLDMLIDLVSYISLWLWNPEVGQFEFYEYIY